MISAILQVTSLNKNLVVPKSMERTVYSGGAYGIRHDPASGLVLVTRHKRSWWRPGKPATKED